MAMTGPRRAWTLDGDAFERLLAFLDPDRERAARRYEDIRRRLVKLFAWRGCTRADECADRTIDRVARKLLEGADIRVADAFQYFHGVAMNVLREYFRDRERGVLPLDDEGPATIAPSEMDVEAERAARDTRLACMERCLARLMPAQRHLLVEYHGGDRHIERRQALSRSLGIPLNALRIRVHRLRATLERCVQACVAPPEAPLKHIPSGRITQ
jgi:DNA-directed RNA polymerase specialized sigma24 family protein